jgi:hypothetical protein
MFLITTFVELSVVAGRSQTWAGRLQVSGRLMLIHTPFHAHAVALSSHFQNGMARVNQTRPHYVNQMSKMQSKPLAARHGRGTEWEQLYVN